MTNDDLLVILKDKMAKYRNMSYAELVQHASCLQPETHSHGEPGCNDFYQIEIEVVHDDARSGNLRVIGMIDNGNGISGTHDFIISPNGTLISEGSTMHNRSTSILHSALALFLLRELPFERFVFPRWQSLAAISLIGVLVGLDPSLRAGTPEMPGMPLWLAIAAMVTAAWLAFLIVLPVLRWWMKRSARWVGQGDLFNLVAASWLVASVLGASAVALGVPPLLTLPLYLYAIWVGGNALSGAIPKASLGYSIGGILLSLVPATLASGLIAALVAALGVATLGSMG